VQCAVQVKIRVIWMVALVAVIQKKSSSCLRIKTFAVRSRRASAGTSRVRPRAGATHSQAWRGMLPRDCRLDLCALSPLIVRRHGDARGAATNSGLPHPAKQTHSSRGHREPASKAASGAGCTCRSTPRPGARGCSRGSRGGCGSRRIWWRQETSRRGAPSNVAVPWGRGARRARRAQECAPGTHARHEEQPVPPAERRHPRPVGGCRAVREAICSKVGVRAVEPRLAPPRGQDHAGTQNETSGRPAPAGSDELKEMIDNEIPCGQQPAAEPPAPAPAAAAAAGGRAGRRLRDLFPRVRLGRAS